MRETDNQNYESLFVDYEDGLANKIASLNTERFVDYRRFRMSGEDKVVVLESGDVLLLKSLIDVFEDFDPRARNQKGIERAFKAADKGFSVIGRLPKVRLVDSNGEVEVFCEEGTCRFHLNNSCLRGEVIGENPEFYDHNPERIWCMDYSSRDETKLNSPYPKLFEEQRIDSEEQYRIKRVLINNILQISQAERLQIGYTGLADGILRHLDAGNVEIRVQGSDDHTFDGSDALFAAGARRFGKGISASYVLVNRDYEEMRGEATFANDAFTLKVFSLAILGIAGLPYIPHRYVESVDSMEVVDAMIAHQLMEAPTGTEFNFFARNLVEEHQKVHPHNQ